MQYRDPGITAWENLTAVATDCTGEAIPWSIDVSPKAATLCSRLCSTSIGGKFVVTPKG